jgi:hypothetical protein
MKLTAPLWASTIVILIRVLPTRRRRGNDGGGGGGLEDIQVDLPSLGRLFVRVSLSPFFTR